MIIIKGVLEVKHAISQRMRFKVKPIRNSQKAADRLVLSVEKIFGVTQLRVNLKSASLVIRYDQAAVTEEEIIAAVRVFFEQKREISEKNRGHQKKELSSNAVRFIGLTAVTVSVFIKKTILGGVVAQGLFSPLGAVVGLASLPLIKKGWDQLKERRFSLEVFLGASILAAAGAGEATAALEILWVTSGGESLQAWITEKSRSSIKNILDVTAKNTYVLIDGVEVEMPVEAVKEGNTVVLHTGEKISVDGKVIKGEALVDESPINGRSDYALRTADDKVYAGTFVRQGVVFVKAEKIGDRTYLSRILTMVEDSLENKAPIEGVADQLAAKLIKAGFAVTFTTWLLTASLWRAFTVMLVMACPCATILSASTAISAALSTAARKNILIKGGRYLEEAGKADIVCFDKTGTLTTNQPAIAEMMNLSEMNDNGLIQLACSAEIHNFHPVALALKKEAEQRKITPLVHDLCEYVLGRGVRAQIQDREILVGSRTLMEDYSVDISGINGELEKYKTRGLTTIFIADTGKVAGVIGFANKERENIGRVVGFLEENGVKEIVILTGDEEGAALNLARKLDVGRCFHSVMPEEKTSIISSLKKTNHKVMMVGDGINDALALAEADIGIAMGAGGSEVAIEAADIALVNDELEGVAFVQKLSQQTIKVVHQNFWIATGSNVIGVVMGAMGILSPAAAGLIHIAHTGGIMLNSSRLLSYESFKIE